MGRIPSSIFQLRESTSMILKKSFFLDHFGLQIRDSLVTSVNIPLSVVILLTNATLDDLNGLYCVLFVDPNNLTIRRKQSRVFTNFVGEAVILLPCLLGKHVNFGLSLSL